MGTLSADAPFFSFILAGDVCVCGSLSLLACLLACQCACACVCVWMCARPLSFVFVIVIAIVVVIVMAMVMVIAMVTITAIASISRTCVFPSPPTELISFLVCPLSHLLMLLLKP
ncbi:hypothetical protein B0T24DRAFT_623688 [Lasiosphaeria ovina]|uniref:Uncharacterized protein n=1 Tax=Lasiosphaeria ovina TaxID=92902 RepID=A0AAE0KCC0_9PEZI|nr:hypothetical protein B0T24DRAFT_623688 [Lasiosphaeria ovina]